METIVEAFEEVDGDLRVVASLRATSWEIEYVDDELEGVYTESDFETAYQSVMANQISTDDFSNVGPLGEVIGQLYFLEEVIVFQFPSSRYEGVFVSFTQADQFPIYDVFETAEELPTLGTD